MEERGTVPIETDSRRSSAIVSPGRNSVAISAGADSSGRNMRVVK